MAKQTHGSTSSVNLTSGQIQPSGDPCDAVSPDEVERLLFVEAEEPGPVSVQVVSLTLTLRVPRPFPVSTLGTQERKVAFHKRSFVKFQVRISKDP